MHIVAHEGQVLKAPDSHPFGQRSAIQFCRVQQDRSSPSWIRTSLSRTSRRSSCSSGNTTGHSSCSSSQRWRLRTSNLQISVSMSLLSMLNPSSRLHQPRERIKEHQQHQQQHQHSPWSFLIPLVFRYLREFRVNLSNQFLVNLQFLSNLSKHLKLNLSNQFRSEEESEQSQDLRILSVRFQRCFRTSRKIDQSSESRSDQCRSSRSSIRRRVELQGLILCRNGIKGTFRDIQADQIREAMRQKSSSRSVLMVMMLMILFLISQTQSRENCGRSDHWDQGFLIGPRPVERTQSHRSLCKRILKQVISRDDKYASTPQATQPSSSFCSWVRFILGKLRCQTSHQLSLKSWSKGWIPQMPPIYDSCTFLENLNIQSQTIW